MNATRNPRSTGFFPALLVPAVTVTLVSLFVMVLAVSALAKLVSAPQPTQAFSDFADVFPGQSRQAVEGQGFSCPISYYFATTSDRTAETCYLMPPAGVFSQVGITLSQGMIRQIGFTLRDDIFTVGDLMLLWGRPEVRQYGRAAYIFWRGQGIYAIAGKTAGTYSLFLPVWRVYMTDFLL